MKIHADFRLFAGTNFDAAKYIASPAAGVNRFMLDRVGNEKARATTIVEYKPNSKFPTHTHVGGEEFLVLDGTFNDEYGAFPANTYVRNPIGTQHAPWVDGDGATIMVKLLQMTADDPLEGVPLHIDLNEAKEKATMGVHADNGATTDKAIIADLYSNPKTGEHVQMCWLPPHAEWKPTTKSTTTEDTDVGGEELFIMEGSLLHDGEGNDAAAPLPTPTTKPTPTEYRRWGWLRFPPSNMSESSHRKLTAGPNGAQVYRKTGHLTEKALAMETIQIDPITETVVSRT